MNDIAYWLGKTLGPVLLVILIGYIVVRVRKKRHPTAKEWGVIAIIAVIIFVLSAVARVMQTAH